MTTATPGRLEPAGRSPMVRLARLLGCTEGQAYTVVIGTVVAVVAALVGLPPTLRDAGVPSAASSAAGVASAPPAPPPNTDTPTPATDAEVAAPQPAGSAVPFGADPVPTPVAAAPDVVAPGAPPSPPAASPPPAVAATGFGPAGVAAQVGAPGAPDGVAVDDAGRIYVATNNALLRGDAGASKVIRYGGGGTPERELTVTGQDPTRTAGLTGVVVAPDGRVLVLDTAPARVLLVDLDRNRQQSYATLGDLPACGPVATADCEAGADDRPLPRAAAIDRDGALFVTDSGQGVIWRVAPDGKASAWYRFGEGEAAGSPTGIAIDGAGDVLVATALSLQPSTGAGLVQRIDVRGDGSAGERTEVAAIDPLSGPAGLAVVPGGAIVVALSSSNVLVLLGPDGTERARVTADEVAEDAGVPLDGPTGVTVRGRSALVTNQSPTANEASHWVVFDVPLTP